MRKTLAGCGLLDAWPQHSVDCREVPARVGEHFGIGGMVGGFDGDDGAAQRRMLVAQVGGEFLLGLRGPHQQYFVCAVERMGDFRKEPRIGRRLVSAVSALAAVDALMLIGCVDDGVRLFGRCEMPSCCFLMIEPDDGVIVRHLYFPGISSSGLPT
jgi:hypothetical protein